MIKFAKLKNQSGKIKYTHSDILKYKFKPSDLFISFYTIQFIHPKFRQKFDK